MSDPDDYLSHWELRTQIWNSLTHAGILTADDLRQVGQDDLRKIYNLGKVFVADIVREAAAHGIYIPRRRGLLDARPAGVVPQDYHSDQEVRFQRSESRSWRRG